METYSRVKRIIEKRGYKVSKLEKILGFKNRCISRWEKCEPRLNNIVRLAQFLDVSLDYLAGLTDIEKFQYDNELYSFDLEILEVLHQGKLSTMDKAYLKEFLCSFLKYHDNLSNNKGDTK